MNESKVGILSKSPLRETYSQKAEALAHDAVSKEGIERKRAAQEFASLLYLEVLKAMRATLPKDGLFETDSLSRDVYSSIFDTEIARVLAKRDNEGFTRTVERAIENMAPMPRVHSRLVPPVVGTISSAHGIRHDLVGERIKAGQAVAIFGSNSRDTGSHLHFEAHQDGKPVDPAPLVGAVEKARRSTR